MSDKTPAEKLRMAAGMTAALLHVPEGVLEVLGVPAGVETVDDPGAAGFVLAFATTQAAAEDRLSSLAGVVTRKTVAWIAYPKGSRAAGHDLNRDTIAAFARTVGLVAVSAVSLDDTWSALRVRPLKPGE
jgi:hypothetical protein